MVSEGTSIKIFESLTSGIGTRSMPIVQPKLKGLTRTLHNEKF